MANMPYDSQGAMVRLAGLLGAFICGRAGSCTADCCIRHPANLLLRGGHEHSAEVACEVLIRTGVQLDCCLPAGPSLCYKKKQGMQDLLGHTMDSAKMFLPSKQGHSHRDHLGLTRWTMWTMLAVTYSYPGRLRLHG